MKTYEAMFLFDPSFAAEAGNPEKEVTRLMERASAQIVMNKKWEERKLAYEIKGRKRGSYWLTFFQADPQAITGIERDAQLSEVILRLLVQRADHMTEEDMNKAYTARSQPVPVKPATPTTPTPATPPKADAAPSDAPAEDKPKSDEGQSTSPEPTKSAPIAVQETGTDSQAPTPAPAD